MTFSRQLVSALLLAALAASACSDDTPSNPTTTCSFSVAQPNPSTFPPEGGTGSSTVTAASSCAWTAVSNAAFITITAGSTGTANGTVSFTVAANTGASRTGTLTVAGTTITITQNAATPTQQAVTLAPPTPRSPVGNVEVTSLRPTLVVDNSAATGTPGAVTYHFEVSDTNAFVEGARTITVDGIPQGSGTTSWPLDRELSAGIQLFWRSRSTNGTVTSGFSNTETFRTPGSSCVYSLSTRDISVNAAGGATPVNIATASTCTWTAVSNSAFITVTSGASGTGSGTATLTVAPNTGAARVGTVTVAGQTVTVSQAATSLTASFVLFDPGRQTSAVTECQIRSLTSVPTQCVLESTSVASGTNTVNTFTWTVSYNYPSAKTFTQTGTNPRFSFTELCGQTGSNDSGLQLELFVTLQVIDSAGNSVTVTSNSGTQPLLTLRAYICGI